MSDTQSPTLLGKLFDAVRDFFTWEAVGRAFLLLAGGVMIFFAVRTMLHGEFTAYRRGGWAFVPPYVFIGAFFIYIGLRKKSLAEWNRESSAPPAVDKPNEDETESRQPKN
jgi:hypothetical protein